MKGSSAQNLIDWRISRCCKLITAALMSVLVLVGSFVLPASAAPEIPSDTSDWIELEAEPHFFYCPYILSNSSLIEFKVGDSLEAYWYSHYGLVFTAGIPIYKDCTYQLTISVHQVNVSRYNTNFVVTKDLPDNVTDLAVQYNSNNKAYLDTVDIKTTYKNNSLYSYTFTFSTADGYIDNTVLGDAFVSLFSTCDPSIFDNGYEWARINITEMSATCIFDPSAEYYMDLTKDRQNKLVDLTKDAVGKMKESLEQVTIIDDMSSAVDYVSGTIGKAAALISPAATFSGDTVNIYPAFALFSNIYNNVMGSVDPALLALAATVPLLCFLAWLFSSLFKSIL